MTGWLRDVRLMPIVLIAVGCLFALKAMGLWLEVAIRWGNGCRAARA